jgi:hypothetical protein
VSGPLAYLRRCERRYSIATCLQLSSVLASVLFWAVTFVYASDCPPNDADRSDCQRAADTARSPLVPLAGAIAGVFVNGALISRTRLQPVSGDGNGKEENKEKEETEYTLDVRTQDLRTTLTADGEDVLWIYGQVRCNKPEIDVGALTSALTFDSQGSNASWLRLEELQMVSGFKAARARAWPPTADAQLEQGSPTVIVTTVIDGNQVSGSVQLDLEPKYVMVFV